MTRSILKALALSVCAAALAAAPMAASAQTMTPMMISPASLPTTISLTANGEVSAAPDKATVSFGVVTQAGTASTAMKNNNVKMNQVMAALKAAGIEAKDIQTSSLNLSPQYDYSNGNQPKITGYQAMNQVSVRVNKLDQTGAVIDAVLAAGVNQIDNISFGLKNDDVLMDQARTQAIKTLTQRANLYASAFGMKVKRVQTISESGPVYNHPMPMMAMRAEAAMDKSTPVASGELQLSVSVSAVFELE
ncbi:SIMPL domain-containing protein [Asticcacaulis biprosthecium]|uniref:SIMPL domain-containing protein n=1 Tax=Asticcacaulis biprosthecium TaxID=76891 RepID=UPI0002DF7F2E|nr:SIMPL domain-containing protein [Asticcacaulis biprosthecium]